MEDTLSLQIPAEVNLFNPDQAYYRKGSILTNQYYKADKFYFLIEGRISQHLFLEEEQKLFETGATSESYTPVGWSGMNFPYRYATTVKVESEEAHLLVWDISKLLQSLQGNPAQAIKFLKYTGIQARRIMLETLGSTVNLSRFSFLKNKQSQIGTSSPNERNGSSDIDPELLRRSPFFESFSDEILASLFDEIERVQIRAGETMFRQGETAKGLYMLEQGWVDFYYHSDSGKDLMFRSISTPGFIISWSGAFEAANLVSAKARTETQAYFISAKKLNVLALLQPQFGISFYRRMLWLISHQLQVVRVRYLYLKFNLENIAIKNLIHQNCTRLSLHSPLHSIPHLLGSKLTQDTAFKILHDLHETGDSHERHIASLCLDNLQELHRENQLYSGLLKTYNIVVTSKPEQNKADNRRICAETFRQAFESTDYEITGFENLPDTPGHIFIYNHLRNHPYNTLPNNFQVTLDSHFISAFILDQKYSDPGIRIVRVGKGIEYGHQEYYERLGHIDVFTQESESLLEDSSYKTEKRRTFYRKARKVLQQQKNLIISPEGTSYSTEESPGDFKTGAFRLALTHDPEPLIVPIVLAGFDKRARHNKFVCMIRKPFRVSELSASTDESVDIRKVTCKIQSFYQEYVREASKIAEQNV